MIKSLLVKHLFTGGVALRPFTKKASKHDPCSLEFSTLKWAEDSFQEGNKVRSFYL